MARHVSERLGDMLDAICDIELIVGRYSKHELASDRVAMAAFERFIEILSEASRHVPAEYKEVEAEIPWQDIANIGNYLRHAYPTVDFGILWDIYEAGQLKTLREAIERLQKVSGSLS